jgi:hypothetical protein
MLICAIFSDVFCIDASSVATIQSGFEDIAHNVSARNTLEDAHRWFTQQRKEWLILLDNADDATIHPVLPARRRHNHVPQQGISRTRTHRELLCL